MTDAAPVGPLDLPRLLLTGDVASRPAGLERALTRAGFRVSEAAGRNRATPDDAVLLTLGAVDADTLARLLQKGESCPPRVVLFSRADPDLLTSALELGADDAMSAPVHLPELCARIHARIRDRQAPRRTAYEQEARTALETLVADARTGLLPDEIVLALVRRLSRAFDLAACAFLIAESGERGRIVAEFGASLGETLDLGQYPEIVEALRTRRPTTLAGPGPAPALVLPIGGKDDRAVLLLRSHDGRAAPSAAQLSLATTLGEAALRAVTIQDRSEGTVPLERRLHEELERARRYSLSFSLVLLAIEAVEEALTRLDEPAGSRLVADVTTELRRTLRVPDFVSRYGREGFALVLPETDVTGARRSVRRIRERLASLEPDGLPAEVSVGIAGYPHPAIGQPDDMFALVEAALRRGRTQSGERIGVVE